MSRGASFFLQQKLTDFLQKLGLHVLSFVGGWTRTYGNEVTSSADATNARSEDGRRSAVSVATTWRFG
jgi:hypothetical protein